MEPVPVLAPGLGLGLELTWTGEVPVVAVQAEERGGGVPLGLQRASVSVQHQPLPQVVRLVLQLGYLCQLIRHQQHHRLTHRCRTQASRSVASVRSRLRDPRRR